MSKCIPVLKAPEETEQQEVASTNRVRLSTAATPQALAGGSPLYRALREHFEKYEGLTEYRPRGTRFEEEEE